MGNEQRQMMKFWELSLDILCLVSFDNRFRDVNPAFERILGYPKEEVVGKAISDFIHVEDLAGSLDEASLHPSGHIAHEFQNRYRCKDGSYKWLSWNSVPVPEEDLIYAIARDITHLKSSEEALMRSNQRISEILDSIQEDFYVLDHDWVLVYTSKNFASRIGKEPKDFVGSNIWDMFPKQLGTAYEKNLRAVMEKREIRRFELAGKYTNAYYSIAVFPSAEGITVLGNDITERKRDEDRRGRDLDALTRMHTLASETLKTEDFEFAMQAIMDTSVAVMRADKGTLQLFENQTLRIVASHGHLTPFLRFFSEAEHVASVCGEATRRGERVIVDDVEQSPLFAGTESLKVLHKACVRSVQSTPLMSHTGRLLGILTTQHGHPTVPDTDDLRRLDLLARLASDIIERKQAEEALKESEHGLIEAQRLAQLGSWQWDVQSGKVRWSDGMYVIFGVDKETFVPDIPAFTDFIHAEDRQSVAEIMNRLTTQGGSDSADFRIVRPDGSIRFIHAEGEIKSFDESGKPSLMIGVDQDITERKKAEAEIAYRATFPELNPSPVVELEATGSIVYMNPAAKALFPNLATLKIMHPYLVGWHAMVNEIRAEDTGYRTKDVKVGDSWYEQAITRGPSS